jgi:CubicO group peptidase (beta-lactamase class C family)
MRRAPAAIVALGAVLGLVACSGDEAREADDVGEAGTIETSAVAPTTSVPAPLYDFTAVGPIVDAFVAERELEGAGLVVVQRDAGIVYEGYWGEFDADRISFVASSSKIITAGVLLHLADEGLLDIDAPIAESVEWGSGNPDVTVAQLLSNSSGLVGLLMDPIYRPYLCQFLLDGTVEDCAEQIFTNTEDDGDVVPPDTEYRYGGAQWQVAGGVAEAVTGKPWAQLIDEIYVQPCGLESLAYNNHFTQLGTQGFEYPPEFDSDPTKLVATDNPNMEAGAYLNAGDYAELLLMHLRGGRCGDEQVLSQEALDRMHNDRIGPVFGGSTQSGGGYGMGWWVDRATGRISDPGAYGSIPLLDLDAGYGAYLVIEADTATGLELVTRIEGLIDAAIEP